MNSGRKKGRDAMNAVRRKLNSKSGISLAIALVFFLLCAMVGTVVLSAVSTSAGSTAQERQLYRRTLALTSASQLLRQDIQAMTFTGSYARTETVTTTVDPDGGSGTKVETGEEYQRGIPTLVGSKLFAVKDNGDGTYSDSLNLTERYFGKLSALFAGIPAVPTEQTIRFQAVEEQNIPEVTGTIRVEEDYTLTVALQCGENRLTMSFPPNVQPQTETAAPVTTKVDDVTTKTVTVTTYSTNLTWGQPLIQEGGTAHGETP